MYKIQLKISKHSLVMCQPVFVLAKQNVFFSLLKLGKRKKSWKLLQMKTFIRKQKKKRRKEKCWWFCYIYWQTYGLSQLNEQNVPIDRWNQSPKKKKKKKNNNETFVFLYPRLNNRDTHLICCYKFFFFFDFSYRLFLSVCLCHCSSWRIPAGLSFIYKIQYTITMMMFFFVNYAVK